jgi:hypothetical protein
MLEAVEVEDALKEDARWQLIERILATGPFQKSARLRELLRYMSERAIHGHAQELTEHNIGTAAFGKAWDYSPVEDSSVRVHARQLRLKLHEYFDGEGREETMIVEIPKGAYTPVFRETKRVAVEPAPVAPRQMPVDSVPHSIFSYAIVPWILSGILAAGCVFLSLRLRDAQPPSAATPWPLSAVYDGSDKTHIVIADTNYGMLRIIGERQGSLEEYLNQDFGQGFKPAHMNEREARIINYISSSNLTSYADAMVATTLSNLVFGNRGLISVRSARDLRLRDLEEGNYVFVGSPGSNPWVSLFQNRLNFQEAEGVVGESMKYFVNKQPLSGEQKTYQGLEFTGSTGEDYATISLLPAGNGRGTVLILQGLQQEGTEAAGLFLANENSRELLKQALNIHGNLSKPVYFEALIRTRAVAGAPNATTIVSTRLIQP